MLVDAAGSGPEPNLKRKHARALGVPLGRSSGCSFRMYEPVYVEDLRQDDVADDDEHDQR
jgi:hypothetical protein